LHQDRFSEALEYYFRALNIRQKIFGINHQKVATTCSNISTVYLKMKDYKLALLWRNKSFNIEKSVLGEDHMNTRNTKQEIAFIKQMQKESKIS